MKISYYKHIKTVSPTKNLDVFKILDLIKGGFLKKEIALIRVESDKTIRNELKSRLPYVTFCGVFSSRSIKGLKIPSGLACLDFDDVKDLHKMRFNVENDKYTFSCFIGPSGNGLKVLVKIPMVDNNDDYQDYYVKLLEHYGKYHDLDSSTKDISRACYLSYDENLFINNDSEIFTEKYNRPLPVEREVINIPITDQNVIAERLDKWFIKRWSSVNRNSNLHAYARQMNAFGVDETTCQSYLLRYDIGGKEKEIKKLISSAYKYVDEFNTRSFEDIKKVELVKTSVLAGKDIDFLKASIPEVAEEKIKAEFEKHKDNLKNDEYWYYNDKGNIKLATYRFLQYLEFNNIYKFYPDKDSGTFLFIKNNKNFISVFDPPKIKDFILTDLRNRLLIDAYELMANNSGYFHQNYLSMVTTIDVKFNRDTKDASYLYYKNFAVKTTKDSIDLLNYNEINDLIWEDQVINREISLKDESDGIFKRFIWLVSGQDVNRYYTLKSVIGYLMHSHQNQARPKSIFFNDEMISEDVPNGGSGKGLIHKAIGQIKSIVTEDGKKFDPKGQFAYQKVNKGTQIFLLDDVPKHFNFESLFSIITEGMTVEKKGQDAYQIPFEESPKISLTTNYTINGSGASHERRVFEVEIANYFNQTHTPEKEFGHMFFVDWDGQEWEKFDNFMIRCVQYYLKHGLVESNKINLAFRKLKNALGEEFMEFMEAQIFDGSPVSRKEFRERFNKEYPQVAKFNTPQKFNSKVKDYCTYYNIPFDDRKYNGVVMFYINNQNNNENDVYEDEIPF